MTYQMIAGHRTLGDDASASIDTEAIAVDAGKAAGKEIAKEGKVDGSSLEKGLKVGAQVAAGAACAAVGLGAAAPLCAWVGGEVMAWLTGTVFPAIADLFDGNAAEIEAARKRRAETAAWHATNEQIIIANQEALAQWYDTIKNIEKMYMDGSGKQISPGYKWVATALKANGAVTETDKTWIDKKMKNPSSVPSTDEFGKPITIDLRSCAPAIPITPKSPREVVLPTTGLCPPDFLTKYREFSLQNDVNATTKYGREVIYPAIQNFFDRLKTASGLVAVQIGTKFAADVAARAAWEAARPEREKAIKANIAKISAAQRARKQKKQLLIGGVVVLGVVGAGVAIAASRKRS